MDLTSKIKESYNKYKQLIPKENLRKLTFGFFLTTGLLSLNLASNYINNEKNSILKIIQKYKKSSNNLENLMSERGFFLDSLDYLKEKNKYALVIQGFNFPSGVKNNLKNNGYEVTYLFQPTLDEMKTEFNKLNKKIDDNDNFIFYVSGHGANFEQINFSGIFLKDKGQYGGDFLEPRDLKKMIKGIDAHREIYFIEACNSGIFIDITKGENELVLTSSKDDEDTVSILASELPLDRTLRHLVKFNLGNTSMGNIKAYARDILKYHVKRKEYSYHDQTPLIQHLGFVEEPEFDEQKARGKKKDLMKNMKIVSLKK